MQSSSDQYDTVYVAVMINSQKKYMFTMEQRRLIAQAAVVDLPNVVVIASDGMLWELARDLDACAIVKGYRNETDLAYEQEMAKFNHAHFPYAKTVLLPSKEEYLSVSSTLVRAKILGREPLNSYLPQAAIDEIYKLLPRNL